jgi:signal transduction histidine kinase
MTFRPLDKVPSIKLKLSIIIVASAFISTSLGVWARRLGVPLMAAPVIATVIAVGFMRLFTFGLTTPLRQMAAATKEMSRGDYSRRIVTSNTDEIGQLAAAFNEMAARMSEVDRQRHEFVANASHELRTPIAALQAMTENLMSGASEADPAFIATLDAQVRRLGHLVDELLSLSRLDSGETSLHLEPTPLLRLCDQVADETSWRDPDLKVNVSVTPLTLEFTLDEMLIHQVLSNLVENARRYGAPPIEIRAALSANGSLLLDVIDNGPGIPASDVQRAFERFDRLGQSRTISGSGLGLAIVAGIVGRHGGTIQVLPHSPHGCHMHIELPPA